jgi:hypothetical protein
MSMQTQVGDTSRFAAPRSCRACGGSFIRTHRRGLERLLCSEVLRCERCEHRLRIWRRRLRVGQRSASLA